MILKTIPRYVLIAFLSLSIVFPNDTNKSYPATSLKVDGVPYLAFKYPTPATNVVQVLIDFELYKKHYEISKNLVKNQAVLLKKQKRDLRREKIRRVFTVIGIALGASATGFGVGYIVRTFSN